MIDSIHDNMKGLQTLLDIPTIYRHVSSREVGLISGIDREQLRNVLSWGDLELLIDGQMFPPSQLAVQRESVLIPRSEFWRNGYIDPVALNRLLYSGVSIIFQKLDEFAPRVRRLCRTLEYRIGEPVTAGAIVTSGRGGAIKVHYDPEDLIILQIEGKKRWLIYDMPVLHPVENCLTSAPRGKRVIFDRMLEAGDCLVVPSGYWHHCENGDERSLHIGLFVVPPTGLDLLRDWVDRLVSETIFRAPLRQGQDAETLAQHEELIKRTLIANFPSLSINAFREREALSRPRDVGTDLGARHELSGSDTVVSALRRPVNTSTLRTNSAVGGEVTNGQSSASEELDRQILDLVGTNDAITVAEIWDHLETLSNQAVNNALLKLRFRGILRIDARRAADAHVGQSH